MHYLDTEFDLCQNTNVWCNNMLCVICPLAVYISAFLRLSPLSFSLLLWCKQQSVECFITWESVTEWVADFKPPHVFLLLRVPLTCQERDVYCQPVLEHICHPVSVITCSQTFIKPSFIFCLLPSTLLCHQPPSHSLRVSWRQSLHTDEASSVETPASLIRTWREKPSPMTC